MKHRKLSRDLSTAYRRVRNLLSLIKGKVRTQSLPVNKDGKVYIHIGCGDINAPGFINVDAIPFSHVNYVRGVDNLSIFPNKHADLVYASHVLEHIRRTDLAKVLREWYRVLKEEGVLRLSVPDFDNIIDIYSSG